MQRVLAYGWYGRGNAGDELMRSALVELFTPRGVTLEFVNSITDADLMSEHCDGVIFGGGSILFAAPNVAPAALDQLLAGDVPVFYVGVGPETEVHPTHASLMTRARLVAMRDLDIPDLVYSLPRPKNAVSVTSGILIVPNVEVVPTSASPHWTHVAWERYKDEMSQVLDVLVDRGVVPTFLVMCRNDHMDDAWPTYELIGRMKRRGWKKSVMVAPNDMETCTLMSMYRAVVTQRYHGIVLAEAAGVPYVALEHHDKLKNVTPHRGQHLQYHGATKAQMLHAIEVAMEGERPVPYHVPHDVYDRLADRVVEQIGHHSAE